MRRSGAEVSEAQSGSNVYYRWFGEYARDYGRALDLWLRYEADADALLRECWDEFPADDIASMRGGLADTRDWWHGLRSHCRSVRENARSNPYLADPWAANGVSC